MAGLIVIVETSRKAIEANCTDNIIGPNNDATDLPALVFTPRRYASCKLHKSMIPVSH